LQADIRRALVHLGRGRLFRRLNRKVSDDDTVEELVTAATTLSAKKIGAIVVIERSIGLRNYIESGIPLDARLTYDLLVSIFQPTSPLHDGAVIMQGDRAAAAACFLPLTINPRLSRELGSRHRAAIGVTEENDAFAIVVSEESRRISIVEDGDLEYDIDAERLRSRLRSVVTLRRTRGKQRRPAIHSADGVPSLSQPWTEIPVDACCHHALADRRGRARRRAGDARASGVPEPAGGTRNRRRRP